VSLLVSVNVGLPADVEWQGKVVHTAVWKRPVAGRVMARRLNLDGDGQGDLAGHGGEHRAVMVYQLDSYRYWETHLQRHDFEYGQFGENLTVDGLADHEVCIGDRYRIGGALFEVTQPRVTCYRVGIRMNNPAMPSLLVSHKRPGFYCRVIEEGEIGAGGIHPVAKQRVRPAQLADETPGVGVEHQLVIVKTMAVLRFVGTADAIAVDQPGLGVGEVAVPDLVCAFGQRNAIGLTPPGRVEQAQIDLLGMRGEHCEISSQAVPSGAQRIGRAWKKAR